MAASLLPNGQQQFCDENGAPYALGTVYMYIPVTTTPKDTWQDYAQSSLNSVPITLDAAGRATIWGTGAYRQILKDADGNTIWDKVTTAQDFGTMDIGGTGYYGGFTATGGETSFTLTNQDGDAFTCAAGLEYTLPLYINGVKQQLANYTSDGTSLITLNSATLVAGDLVYYEQVGGESFTAPGPGTISGGAQWAATVTLNDTTFTSNNGTVIKVRDAGAFIIQNQADPTKQAEFSAAGITAGQTRVFSFPDGTTTLVGTDLTQTLSAKTFVAPVLGTPTSGTLTNCDGLPVTTGISGLGTGVATALAINVGSAGAPVVNGGALGTPSSGTMTNVTGLPVATGISGLGAGVATWLATPSSANLAAAVTGETGTGALVFADAPTFSGIVTFGGSSTITAGGALSIKAASVIGTDSSGSYATKLGISGAVTAVSFKLTGDTASQLAGMQWVNNTGTETANLWMTGDGSNGVWRFQKSGTGGRIDFIIGTVTIANNNPQFRVSYTASPSRWLDVTGSNGGDPTMASSGGNINLAPASSQTVVITTLPVASAGLPSGALWNNSNVVNVV